MLRGAKAALVSPTPLGAAALFDAPSAALACAVQCVRTLRGHRTPVKAALLSTELPLDLEFSQRPERQLAGTMLDLAGPQQILCDHACALLVQPLHPEWPIVNVGCFDIAADFPRRRLFAIGYPGHPPEALDPPRALPSGVEALPLPLGRDTKSRLRWRELATEIRGRDTQLITLVASADHPERTHALAVLVRELAPGYGSVYYVAPDKQRSRRPFAQRLLATIASHRPSSEDAHKSLLALLGGHAILVVIDGLEPRSAQQVWLLRYLIERRPELTCIVVTDTPLGCPEEWVLSTRLTDAPGPHHAAV